MLCLINDPKQKNQCKSNTYQLARISSWRSEWMTVYDRKETVSAWIFFIFFSLFLFRQRFFFNFHIEKYYINWSAKFAMCANKDGRCKISTIFMAYPNFTKFYELNCVCRWLFFSGKFFNIANSQRIDCKNKCEFCLPVRWTAKNCAQGNSKEITSEATVKRWILHSLTLHTEKECRRRLNWFRVESKYFEWSNAVDQQNRL